MDSDGFCHKKNGHVEFVQKRKWISELAFELAASLGYKPVITTGNATLYGKDCGKKHRVTWRPRRDMNPFRLKRKADLVQDGGKQNLRNLHRMIVSYTEIDKIPMRCLTVDSPNSLFLIGKSYIPTHNTRTGAEWVRNAVENEGVKRIALIGPNVSSVRDVIFYGQSGLFNITPEGQKPTYVHSKAEIYWPNGAKAKVVSAEEPDNLRGPEFDLCWIDELAACKNAEQLYHDVQFPLRLNSKKGFPPRLLMTTTPRPLQVLKDIKERGEEESSSTLLIMSTLDFKSKIR